MRWGSSPGWTDIAPHRVNVAELFRTDSPYDVDYLDVKGQPHAKRACGGGGRRVP